MTGLITLAVPSEIIRNLPGNEHTDLESLFLDPPLSVYPQAYWFWMNGHVTKQGITLDLEAMKRIGVGGVFNFDGGSGIPKGPVQYLSSQWLDLKLHAIQEAERLGLEFTMHNCPGWSSSGGPWITAELAMQQVTWSETYVRGDNRIDISLPKPFHKNDYYQDVAVLAYPSLEGEAELQTLSVTSSEGPVDIKNINGQDPQGVIIQPQKSGQAGWLLFEFAEPYPATSITFLISSTAKNISVDTQAFSGKRSSVLLEFSENGKQFYPVTVINTGLESELLLGNKFITYDFQLTRANFFRLTFDQARKLAQIRFSAITRLNNFMEKAAYRFMFTGEGISDIFKDQNQGVPEASITDLNSIIDLSKYIDKEGHLQWHAPSGNWTVLRMGFTPIGTLNRSAPDSGVGLECDKFNPSAINFHFNKMMDPLLPILKQLGKKRRVGLEIDSYEAGMQNWTPGLPGEFQSRRGYDLKKYLLALTGRVVQSVDHTERFLWDFRRTLADMMADHYYGSFHQLCKQHGFTSYIEPYDKGPMEEMQIGSRVDVNIGEFWNGLFSILQGNIPIRRTPKLVASIAHINGQKTVGVEAFTSEPESSRWQEYPFALKALGDKMFTKGVNQMIIHRFAHQPHPSASPGMTMGPWGIHFDRTNTWWNEGKAWMNYLARCQSMLRQGLFVADLAYFTGEEANIYTPVNAKELNPAPPEGFDYDLINAEAILSRVKIDNGRIVLPDGMNYRVLVLQNYKALTLTLLRKLLELVQQGMVLVGAKPERSLGLTNYPESEISFRKIADELWGPINGNSVTQNNLGKGLVIWGQPLLSILQSLDLKPDFSCSSHSGDAPVSYIHRKIEEKHFYFLSNERRTSEHLVCTFRVQGMQPELWDASTGKITPQPIFELVEDGIRLPIHLEPYGSVFVVFRSPAPSNSIHSIEKNDSVILSTKPFAKPSRKLFKEIRNNFTIALWAKPEINVMLGTSIHMEKVKHPYTDYYAIYPPTGLTLYGEGHATCGLAIGRNGIAVWENNSGTPVLVLAARVPISGWSHIALIYHEGVPSVFLDGKKIQTGQPSSWTIHPGLGEAYISEGASYYNGDMIEPGLFPEVLSQEMISQMARVEPPKPKAFQQNIEIVGRKPGILFWQSGNYKLCNAAGEQVSFRIDVERYKELKGPWMVQFPSGLGAPGHIVLAELMSLHKHQDNGVKYFSGTSTYNHEFFFSFNNTTVDKRYFLDLGRVEVIASVTLNGKNLGILWKRPYRVDVTGALKTGKNKLIIRVTNLWPNRLIGDEHKADPDQFAADTESGSFERIVGGGIQQVPNWYIQRKPKPDNGRITFTTWKHYTKDSPLLESGLIGPVVLEMAVLKML